MSKYRNKKTELDGIKFDSQREAKRYWELKLLQRAGEINNLRLQVPFILIEKSLRDDGSWERECKYIADFTYLEDGKLIVEDVKSVATKKNKDFIIKRKLLLSMHGITLKEIL